jgi:hypothetical protein
LIANFAWKYPINRQHYLISQHSCCALLLPEKAFSISAQSHKAMPQDIHNIFNENYSTDLLNPTEIINNMIDLRIQLAELEQQIQDLQPAFFAACMALKTEKIELERAIISRRLTPAQWTYSPDILEQQDILKQLKRQFQQKHEPTSGRDITWVIKLLLATV